MKNSAEIYSAEMLQTKLKEREDRLCELERLPKLRASNAAVLPLLEDALELAPDLTQEDAKTITHIGHLKALDSIIERRTTKLETGLQQFDSDLLEFSNKFISQELGPRARALATRLAAKVAEELRPHFPDRIALDHAVRSSQVVKDVEGLQWTINFNLSDVAAHANGVLNSFRKLEEFEAKHAK